MGVLRNVLYLQVATSVTDTNVDQLRLTGTPTMPRGKRKRKRNGEYEPLHQMGPFLGGV